MVWIYLAMDTLLVEKLSRYKQTFSVLILPPQMIQIIQPLPSFNFNLIITISQTNLSYTYNQILVTNYLLRTPPPLA